MKNQELIKLNFEELINYNGMPDQGVQNRYDYTIPCNSFCVNCEQHGYLDDKEYVLDQMSHGADTWDFEQLLGALSEPHDKTRIIFLLESPGGDKNNGKFIEYNGIIKRPPVCHYYWTPSGDQWPTDPFNLCNLYGPYFAYLLNRFHFCNAYFTNAIKCSLADVSNKQFIPYKVTRNLEHRDSKIRNNCFKLFLCKEIEILKPEIIFCFGTRTKLICSYLGLERTYTNTAFKELYHPAARIRTIQFIEENNSRIQETLDYLHKIP